MKQYYHSIREAKEDVLYYRRQAQIADDRLLALEHEMNSLRVQLDHAKDREQDARTSADIAHAAFAEKKASVEFMEVHRDYLRRQVEKVGVDDEFQVQWNDIIAQNRHPQIYEVSEGYKVII